MSVSIEGNDDIPIKLDVIYGHIEMESRMRPVGNRIIGEGRSKHYDRDGKLVKDTGWVPTGVELYWDDEPCRCWWEFWK